MAKPPARCKRGGSIIDSVEEWLDTQIPPDATEFYILASTIISINGKLAEEDWEALCERYVDAGWKNATHNHRRPDVQGKFFRLEM